MMLLFTQMQSGVKEVAIFGAASESFSKLVISLMPFNTTNVYSN